MINSAFLVTTLPSRSLHLYWQHLSTRVWFWRCCMRTEIKDKKKWTVTLVWENKLVHTNTDRQTDRQIKKNYLPPLQPKSSSSRCMFSCSSGNQISWENLRLESGYCRLCRRPGNYGSGGDGFCRSRTRWDGGSDGMRACCTVCDFLSAAADRPEATLTAGESRWEMVLWRAAAAKCSPFNWLRAVEMWASHYCTSRMKRPDADNKLGCCSPVTLLLMLLRATWGR